MGLKFCSIASGSSGNSYLVKSDNTNILVDAGISGKRICDGAGLCGVSPENIDGILVTHEHTDHIKSLRMMSRKAKNGEIFTSEGTACAIFEKMPALREKLVIKEGSFAVGDIEVRPFQLSHDAEDPVGFTLSSGGRRVTIITDTGVFSREMVEEAAKSDLLVLEANHEVNILHCGPYPYELKRRILSDVGHLSNETSAEFIYEMNEFRKNLGDDKPEQEPRILLAHLSRENNSPMQAVLTIKNRLFEEDMIIGRDFQMDVASHDRMGKLLEV
ncbi:MAG: MBL fold metallo-hydrolase [Clostridiales bacterium]|nr:MBL fold metallo-hydrolase [Clostridiales bacterium]